MLLFGLAIIFSSGMGTAAAAPGDTIYVNGSGGSDANDGSTWLLAKKTIKNATETVNDNGSVNIADGTYSGSKNSNIIISKNMEIVGESTKNTIIDGLKSGQSIFNLNPGLNVTVINLTFINGYANGGAAIFNSNSNLVVINSSFLDNNVASSGAGGAIFSYGGNLTVTNSVFNNNTAGMFGGAIFTETIYNQVYNSTTIINDCTFTNNIASSNGGAIELDNGITVGMVNLFINNSTFIKNHSYNGGAIDYNGIMGYNNNNITVTNCTFLNNSASYGGAVLNNFGTTSIHFCRFIGNTATIGNSINNQGGSANATQNWWGSNSGPSNNDIAGPVTCNPWMVLTINASPNFILNYGNSTITVDLLHDSNGSYYDPANGHIPDGIFTSFIITLGNMVNPVYMVNGIVNSTLISQALGGTAYIIATVDNQSVLTQVILIDTVPPSASANPAGGYYNTTKNVYLSMNEPGTIYYTTDGSTPTYKGDRYSSHLIITNTTTLKFFAMDLSGNCSPVYTEIYTIDTKAPTVTANPIGGLYNSTKNVTLKMSESGTIYYTLNGTTPTKTSNIYKGPISITNTTTLKYMAMDLAGNKSPIYSQLYTIDKTAPKVSSTIPTNNKSNVSRTSSIVIKFTKNIKSSANYSKVTLKNLTTGKTVTVKLSITNNTLTIKPSSVLSAKTSYQVTIPASAVKDYAGNNLVANYILKYKTGA